MIVEKIKKEIGLIEENLKKFISSQVPFINQVSEYVLFAGGKRIRPLLTVICAKLFSPNLSENLYRTSILFEYLHAATLLHDDVVDSAEFRRGRKAARNLWGNQATILVGDYLYARALKLASELRNPEVMEVITETTLIMSEGEVLQLLNLYQTEISEEAYEEVIFRKTAALISACCEVGAIIGGASPAEREKLKNFGKYLGLSFQIIDDLLDYLSTETGKDLGRDFKEGKITLPVIYALKQASSEDKRRLLELLTLPEPKDEFFEEAKNLIEKNQGFKLAQEKALDYINQAKHSLDGIPENLYKQMLIFITDYLTNRKK
ncbi:polyprenyl synthetase family protein [Thermodesulfobacterium sp. TA1]|uniref:polyprenyl synthetase family protein n=1 Tax=Thermodesulfobacterium sp. TA1 TaxID=2234087 RepID=UPI0012324815|nr:polyprenyl synthetase family protein [Thermodesulfobacterium sp. TA1]QER42536.1 polyprenyl synthetase family protein [Thermodesulfobacterium sp. TA1]